MEGTAPHLYVGHIGFFDVLTIICICSIIEANKDLVFLQFDLTKRKGNTMFRRRIQCPCRTLFDKSLAAQHSDGIVPLGVFDTSLFPEEEGVTEGCHSMPRYWVLIDDVPDGEDNEGLNSMDPLAIIMREQEEALSG